MEINFEPIPPDTYSSLRQDLIDKAREYGLVDCFESGSMFGGVVIANFNYDDPKVKEFIEWAKHLCVVTARL